MKKLLTGILISSTLFCSASTVLANHYDCTSKPDCQKQNICDENYNSTKSTHNCKEDCDCGCQNEKKYNCKNDCNKKKVKNNCSSKCNNKYTYDCDNDNKCKKPNFFKRFWSKISFWNR